MEDTRERGFRRTCEGLKRGVDLDAGSIRDRFRRTCEGLKQAAVVDLLAVDVVSDGPVRD